MVPACSGKQLVDNNLVKFNLIKMTEVTVRDKDVEY